MTRKLNFTDEEKNLVEYLKEKLKSRGINKFPRDWHLKQLSTARDMLAGSTAPTPEQWKECIDWAFQDEFWGDKIDHLARIFSLWSRYILQKSKSPQKSKRVSRVDTRDWESI